jgi:hypothetical protein
MVLRGGFCQAGCGGVGGEGGAVVFEGDAVFVGEEEGCAVDVEAGRGWGAMGSGVMGVSCGGKGGYDGLLKVCCVGGERDVAVDGEGEGW